MMLHNFIYTHPENVCYRLPDQYWATRHIPCNRVSVSPDIERSLTHSLSHPPTLLSTYMLLIMRLLFSQLIPVSVFDLAYYTLARCLCKRVHCAANCNTRIYIYCTCTNSLMDNLTI